MEKEFEWIKLYELEYYYRRLKKRFAESGPSWFESNILCLQYVYAMPAYTMKLSSKNW